MKKNDCICGIRTLRICRLLYICGGPRKPLGRLGVVGSWVDLCSIYSSLTDMALFDCCAWRGPCLQIKIEIRLSYIEEGMRGTGS